MPQLIDISTPTVLRSPLVQLTYVSARSANVLDDDVVELAIKSNIANRQAGINGCLWFGARRFFQVLEGEQDRVDRLYRKIKVDGRHTSVRLLSYSSIVSHQFARWNLAHVSHNEDSTIEKLILEYAGGEPGAPAEQPRSGALQRILERLRAVLGQRPDSVM